jgi:hypothetical protein
MPTIQNKRGTSSGLSSANPLLLDGEIIIESDTNKLKVGNGVYYWNELNYLNANTSGINIVNSSGNFTSLTLNGTTVSVSGHTHTSSNITDFNTSVSGLLPTIANSGDNRVLTSTGSSLGVNAESNLTFDGSLLNVTGSGSFSGDIRTSGSFIGGSGTAVLPSFEFINDPDTGLFSPSANTFGISTSGVERLRVNNIGNIGIGTSSPSSKLHIYGDIKIDSNAETNTNLIFNNDGSQVADFTWDWTNEKLDINSLQVNINTENGLVVETIGHIQLNPNGGGNVGIGTSSPGSPLTISAGGAAGTIGGASQTQIFQVNDASASDYINLGHFNCESNLSRGSFMLSNNGTNGLWEDNVIQFLCHGSSYGYGYYGGNLSDAGCAMIVTQGSEIVKLQIGNYNAAPIEFFTDNTFRVRIDTSGNVGIGTSTPSEKLDVVGNIKTDSNLKINNTSLSESQLINIINGGNLYLWSNFR